MKIETLNNLSRQMLKNFIICCKTPKKVCLHSGNKKKKFLVNKILPNSIKLKFICFSQKIWKRNFRSRNFRNHRISSSFVYF